MGRWTWHWQCLRGRDGHLGIKTTGFECPHHRSTSSFDNHLLAVAPFLKALGIVIRQKIKTSTKRYDNNHRSSGNCWNWDWICGICRLSVSSEETHPRYVLACQISFRIRFHHSLSIGSRSCPAFTGRREYLPFCMFRPTEGIQKWILGRFKIWAPCYSLLSPRDTKQPLFARNFYAVTLFFWNMTLGCIFVQLSGECVFVFGSIHYKFNRWSPENMLVLIRNFRQWLGERNISRSSSIRVIVSTSSIPKMTGTLSIGSASVCLSLVRKCFVCARKSEWSSFHCLTLFLSVVRKTYSD